ncbi:hypothetical protein HYALB_00001681 [Hymenoscyphus albidus]|uniref:Uncharacterized protein n=1 Tax=Hymenoscyphus albidus TaxID=595503 RepID=A0A9N9PRC7_9HELO|nr:hypothetical protein HYALB_00001681 [Hymenoscyphus albidus]
MELESAQARKRSTGTGTGTGSGADRQVRQPNPVPVPVPGLTQRSAAQRNAHHHCHCGLNRVKGATSALPHYGLGGAMQDQGMRVGEEMRMGDVSGGDEDGRWEMDAGERRVSLPGKTEVERVKTEVEYQITTEIRVPYSHSLTSLTKIGSVRSIFLRSHKSLRHQNDDYFYDLCKKPSLPTNLGAEAFAYALIGSPSPFPAFHPHRPAQCTVHTWCAPEASQLRQDLATSASRGHLMTASNGIAQATAMTAQTKSMRREYDGFPLIRPDNQPFVTEYCENATVLNRYWFSLNMRIESKREIRARAALDVIEDNESMPSRDSHASVARRSTRILLQDLADLIADCCYPCQHSSPPIIAVSFAVLILPWLSQTPPHSTSGRKCFQGRRRLHCPRVRAAWQLLPIPLIVLRF